MSGISKQVKIVTVMAIVACVGGALSAQQTNSAQIKWNSDPDQAVQTARERKLPVLVYVTSAQCTYCRKMERQSWTDAAVVQAVSGDYVPLKISSESHPRLVQKLNVQAFPTTILFTSQLKIHGGAAGYLSPQELTQMLARRPASVARADVGR